jgi:hypothetical protein
MLMLFNTTHQETIAAGKGDCDRADRFDDVYPGIYVMDLGLSVGEKALLGRDDP